MAKRIINEKGFKVIALTPCECARIGFGCFLGAVHELICDNCNDIINNHDEVYYIPVLNRVFCKECFDEWYSHAEYYPEDSRWETHRYNDTVSKLEVNCIGIEETNYDE